MAILLLRHGNSVRRDGLDAARPLSQAGRKEIEATIERAAQELLGQRIGFCVSSHLVRAVQSAEIACATFKKARVEVPAWIDADPCFEPDANPLVAAQRLEALEAEHGTVLCACHEPIIRHLTAILAPEVGATPYATGEIACIENKKVRWRFAPSSLAPGRERA